MTFSQKILEYLEYNKIKYLSVKRPNHRFERHRDQILNDASDNAARAVILKTNGHFEMIVLSAEEEINIERMKALIGEDSIRIATRAECRKLFPECDNTDIPVLGNLFNMRVYCSMSFLSRECVCFKAGAPYKTIKISLDDFIRIAHPVVGCYTKHAETYH